MNARVALAIAGFFVLAGVAVQAELIDQIAATVDTEVILYSDLVSEVTPVLQEIQAQSPTREAFDREREKVVREALDTAIERKILYREAQLAGIEVKDKDVEERLNKIIEGYDSVEEFRRALEEAGENMGDFRETLRKQIMAITFGTIKRKDFEKDVVISDAEVRQYYQDHESEFSRPERMKVRRIFLGAGSDPAERAKVKARLEALAEEARLGADFGELAKKYSEGPDAAESGLMGWVAKGDLVPELESVVFALSEGGLSEVVETQWGFNLLRVDQKEGAGTASFEEARTDIEPMLRAQYADEHYKKWMGELRKRSRVRVYL